MDIKDLHQLALTKGDSLAIVFAAHNEKQAAEIQGTIENFLYKNFPEIEFYFDREII